MSWNAWGISWGDSWGSSWGPLHEVEEYPGQYYGSGKRLPVQPARKPDPGTEDDDSIIRKVLDKWEFIESIQRADAAKQAPVAIKAVAEVAHQAMPVVIVESAIVAAVPAIQMVQDPIESIELAAQRERNENSLALILAAL